mmetsp:Transcript_15916/g.39019  ORF Transcript_15916/g.39019 Transcript_15916/m.39019 type:complete len:147 (-) Transcript_15916:29-469(-)
MFFLFYVLTSPIWFLVWVCRNLYLANKASSDGTSLTGKDETEAKNSNATTKDDEESSIPNNATKSENRHEGSSSGEMESREEEERYETRTVRGSCEIDSGSADTTTCTASINGSHEATTPNEDGVSEHELEAIDCFIDGVLQTCSS